MPENRELVKVTESGGVGLYVQVHMTDDTPRQVVEQFVMDATTGRGYTVGYDPDSHMMVELYVPWSDDQGLLAEELKRWVAERKFVRLLVVEYAYDHRQSRR